MSAIVIYTLICDLCKPVSHLLAITHLFKQNSAFLRDNTAIQSQFITCFKYLNWVHLHRPLLYGDLRCSINSEDYSMFPWFLLAPNHMLLCNMEPKVIKVRKFGLFN